MTQVWYVRSSSVCIFNAHVMLWIILEPDLSSLALLLSLLVEVKQLHMSLVYLRNLRICVYDIDVQRHLCLRDVYDSMMPPYSARSSQS